MALNQQDMDNLEAARQAREAAKEAARQVRANYSLKDRLAAMWLKMALLKKLFQWLKDHMPGSKKIDILENEIKKMNEMTNDAYWMAGTSIDRINKMSERIEAAIAVAEDLTLKAKDGKEISDPLIAAAADKLRSIGDEFAVERKRYDKMIQIIEEEMGDEEWFLTELPDGRSAYVCPEKLKDKDNKDIAVITMGDEGIEACSDLKGSNSKVITLDADTNEFMIKPSETPLDVDATLEDLKLGDSINISKGESLKDRPGDIRDMYVDLMNKQEMAKEYAEKDLAAAINKNFEKEIDIIAKDFHCSKEEAVIMYRQSDLQAAGVDVETINKDGNKVDIHNDVKEMDGFRVGHKGGEIQLDMHTNSDYMVTSLSIVTPQGTIPFYGENKNNPSITIPDLTDSQRKELNSLVKTLPVSTRVVVKEVLAKYEHDKTHLPPAKEVSEKDSYTNEAAKAILEGAAKVGAPQVEEIREWGNILTAEFSNNTSFSAITNERGDINLVRTDKGLHPKYDKNNKEASLQAIKDNLLGTNGVSAVTQEKIDSWNKNNPDAPEFFKNKENLDRFVEETSKSMEHLKEARSADRAGKEDVGVDR